jgi:hypothetical protein
MAESEIVPNWGDLACSRSARMSHPIGEAEGRQKAGEESELVIVLGAWESHVQGEERVQKHGASSHHFPHPQRRTRNVTRLDTHHT